ncbi:MAG: antibiotic biosynthesis monooxygenase [Opitutaceae bacterium]|nr:antibiotic biosynthesis monooxygenase [Opitutaceae bacterium]
MLVLIVHIHVKSECIGAFKAATIENARNSIREPGVARFDVIQQTDDPTRFVLIEVYRTPEAPAAHKATAHYHDWLKVTEPMMVTPRTRATYTNIHPADSGW